MAAVTPNVAVEPIRIAAAMLARATSTDSARSHRTWASPSRGCGAPAECGEVDGAHGQDRIAGEQAQPQEAEYSIPTSRADTTNRKIPAPVSDMLR